AELKFRQLEWTPFPKTLTPARVELEPLPNQPCAREGLGCNFGQYRPSRCDLARWRVGHNGGPSSKRIEKFAGLVAVGQQQKLAVALLHCKLDQRRLTLVSDALVDHDQVEVLGLDELDQRYRVERQRGHCALLGECFGENTGALGVGRHDENFACHGSSPCGDRTRTAAGAAAASDHRAPSQGARSARRTRRRVRTGRTRRDAEPRSPPEQRTPPRSPTAAVTDGHRNSRKS